MSSEGRRDAGTDTVAQAVLVHAALVGPEPAFRPVVLWRLLAGGALGAALGVLIVVVVPLTRIGGAALGAGPPLAGMVLGGLLDLRVLSRRLERDPAESPA